MRSRIIYSLVLFALIFNPFVGTAQHSELAEDGLTLQEEIKLDIRHHLQDGHDYHLFTDESTGSHYGFPLPVILVDEGVHFFMSSAFHHDEEVAESNGKFYAVYHNKIYRTDAEGTLSFDADHHPTNVKPLDLSITKNVFHIMVIGLLMIVLFGRAANNYKNDLVPRGAAKFVEPIVLFVRDEIARPNIGEKSYRKYMGFLLTVFFFIWIVNLFGLTPLGVNINNSVAVTFALALITFLITNLSGTKTYWLHILDPLGKSMPWYGKLGIYPLLVPIEILGIFIKPFALMIRLYANITAGHIVMMSLLGLIFIFKSWIGSPLSFGLAFFIGILELLVAALQAYIFTMLSALYFGSAAAEPHHDH
ncbi:MAG: F0F1 ATP synthase subunit A [Flavobacteriales bacterium]|nr:F0F1 ATP synthase subunit A [Flavobacteriales bacterium]